MSKNDRLLPQQQRQTFVTDGGIETHLIFNEGQDAPDMSVYVLNDSEAGRRVMRDYYRAYIGIARKAGQGFVFDTNTWRANPDWGARAGYDSGMLRAANMQAVAFCQQMQAEFTAAGVRTIISGVLGPRRDAWQYDAAMTVEEAMAYHRPQMEAFAATDADYVSAYTLTNTPEAVGIAQVAKAAGMPVVLSFTLETDGNLPGGKSLATAIGETDAATGGYPAYYMINCVHPMHFEPVLRRGGAWVERIGGLRVNASKMSHAELDNSPVLDIGDIDDLARRYAETVRLIPNMAVFGGCCGTDHRHIGSICEACFSGGPH